MNFLTVVERELRVAARRPGVRRSRLLCAMVGVAVVSWFLLVPQFNNPQQFGQFLFYTLSVGAFVIAGFSGFAATADCLSEEKREGTLGLLFLTELKGRDVIIGKLVASSLSVIYGLLGILPVIAISILAGGVSGSDFARVVITALNLLFLSLCIGMMSSVIYQQGAHSLAAAATLFLFLLVGLPFCLFIVVELFGIRNLNEVFTFPCPGYTCLLTFPASLGRMGGSTEFYSSLAVTHLIGWACLIFAMMRVARSWQDRIQGSLKESSTEPMSAPRKPSARVRFRQSLMDLNPYFWRAARPHYRGRIVWGVMLFALGIFAGGWLFRPDYFRDTGSYFFMAFLLNTILKLWIATEAPGPLASDRHGGALELLLVTSLTEQEITQGQQQALWKWFAWPIYTVLGLTALFIMSILSPHSGSPSETSMLAWMLLSGMLVLVMDCITLARLGQARALQAKSESRAVLASVFTVLILPWLLYFALISSIGLLYALGFRIRALDSWEFLLALWVSLSLGVDLFALRYSNRILPAQLRPIASARFDAR